MKEFEAGGHYGIELSSMNNYKIIKEAIKQLRKYKIEADRFDECRGLMRLPKEEIKDMIKITHDNKIGMLFSIGPRPIYDIGGFVKSRNGQRIGYRLRGPKQLEYAINLSVSTSKLSRIISIPLSNKAILSSSIFQTRLDGFSSYW